MKKILAMTLVLITIVALFAGCTQTKEEANTAPPQETTQADPNNSSSGPSAKIAAEATDAQGTLVGWIDGNSVEIEMTPVDTLAFRVTDVLDQLEGIKDGDKVKFSYKQNAEGQMTITKIETLQ